MKKALRLLLFTLGVLLVAFLFLVWYASRRDIGSSTRLSDAPAPTTIPLTPGSELFRLPGLAEPAHPIFLPPGFAIGVYASGLQGPRMMTLGPDGQLYVAERGAGRIMRLPDRDGDLVLDGLEVAAEGLEAPSSLAFYRDGSLYIGETTQVLRLSDPDGDGFFQQQEVIVPDLPSGGHNTRTVLFSPDWQYLFVSVGSSCNVCIEEDDRRATILRFNPDGSGGEVYAWGLRNAVGLAFRPGTDELWATNNGRDLLGDDLPPETVYRIDSYEDHGWPYCHSGRIIDPDYGRPDSCDDVVDPAVEMQAHSAPLGLTFYTGELSPSVTYEDIIRYQGLPFPSEYQGDLFVAFHGSWNRSEPTGYKIVRIPFDDHGTPGPVQDFATGWLLENDERWGRPVDVLTSPFGGLFVSDDSGGMIYLILYLGE
jgi:glucose/arabinose dehydrogenase